jgi:hypothetical protein
MVTRSPASTALISSGSLFLKSATAISDSWYRGTRFTKPPVPADIAQKPYRHHQRQAFPFSKRKDREGPLHFSTKSEEEAIAETMGRWLDQKGRAFGSVGHVRHRPTASLRFVRKLI